MECTRTEMVVIMSEPPKEEDESELLQIQTMWLGMWHDIELVVHI